MAVPVGVANTDTSAVVTVPFISPSRNRRQVKQNLFEIGSQMREPD